MSDNKIEEVIVKIWEMSKVSQDPIVRKNTLDWAREELNKLLTPQPDEGMLLCDEEILKLLGLEGYEMGEGYACLPKEDLMKLLKAQLQHCEPLIREDERERFCSVVVDTLLKVAYPVSERRQDGKERLGLQIKEGMGRGK